MLLEQHLLQLFGNLPYLPKAEITKHLDYIDLIKAYLVSENWDEAIEFQKNDVASMRKIESSLYMISKKDRVVISFFGTSLWGGQELIIDFPVESVLENSTENVENGVRMIFHSENFKQFENRILMAFNRIRSLFAVDTEVIQVNLDHGFNLEFLKKLRLEKLSVFELSGDKKDGQIDGKELSDLLNTWEIKDSVRIKIETTGEFEGNLEMLEGSNCEFTDSRWITGDMLIKTFRPGTFKRCLLTSEDFNAYFKKWRNTEEYVDRLECHMENELDVEKVLEGLEAKKWDPMERGRMYRGIGYTYIDLADGMDISRSDGKLATIHISADKKVIRFFQWHRKFPLQEDKKEFTRRIDQLKPKLKKFAGCRSKLAIVTKDLEEYEAKLQAVEEQIARENKLSMN